MGSFCKRKPSQDSAGNQATSQSTSSANAGMAASMDGSQEKYDNLGPIAKAAQDLKMDMGVIPKDNQYYANLASRQQASQDALQKMKDDKPNKPKVDEKIDTKEVVTGTTGTTETTKNTTLDNDTDTKLTNVETISTKTFGGDGEGDNDGDGDNDKDVTKDIKNYFDDTVTGVVNTASGQDTNMASALTTSVGDAEDEAISYMDSGTGSNVVNTGGAQGLLAGDDEDEFDPFNRRKTLIGA